MAGSSNTGKSAQAEAAAALDNDFRERMTKLLEDLDAAGEAYAALHVEEAIAKLS